MREFVYFSSKARTSGNFDSRDLKKAGRMDIACHVVVNALFLSHKTRQDVKVHMVFYGSPTPPRYLEISSAAEGVISKKDVARLIQIMLYKYKEGKKTEVFPGCFIEKKNLSQVLSELEKQGKEIYILDEKGEDIRAVKLSKEPVFLLGDQDGLPAKELKRLKKTCQTVSVGRETYFASQTITIVNNELDRQNI